MGPRSFRRGNLVATFYERQAIPLQWGRDPSIAEMWYWGPDQAMQIALQWGRDLSIAEMNLYTFYQVATATLQWGRDLAMAEMSGGLPACIRSSASMGPRSFDGGCDLTMAFQFSKNQRPYCDGLAHR